MRAEAFFARSSGGQIGGHGNLMGQPSKAQNVNLTPVRFTRIVGQLTVESPVS
jgi:hypothetical protein